MIMETSELPSELTEDMIPNYVYYCKEEEPITDLNIKSYIYNREYFKIKNHPKYKYTLTGSKSPNIIIQDKLNEIKYFLKKIDKRYEDIDLINKLPDTIKYLVSAFDFVFVFEYFDEDVSKLYTKKLICDDSLSFSENLSLFYKLIHRTYPELKLKINLNSNF